MTAIAVIVDTAWYARRYPDVPEAEALRHFVAHGLAEGRDPNPFFDGAWYAREYPDTDGLPPLLHYLQAGAGELRDPHPRFAAEWYVRAHPEARPNPLLHHLKVGAARQWPTEPPPDFSGFLPEAWADAAGRPVVLLITEQPNENRSDIFRLLATSRGVELSAPGWPEHGTLRLAPERAGELLPVLRDLGVERVRIADLAPGLFDLGALVCGLGLPFEVELRDYLAICPQRHLLPWPDAQYCGEPGPAGCNACIAARPSHGATDILTWRRGHAWLFREAERVLCPSLDALARLQRHGLAERAVVPASAGGAWPAAFPKLAARARLRVAVLGRTGPHQGEAAVEAVGEQAGRAGLDLQILTGTDATGALRAARPHVVWFPAQWPDPDPEGLAEAVDAGLPIVAARAGAFPERLAGRRLSWLVDPGADVQGWLDAFAQVRAALLGAPPKMARRPRAAATPDPLARPRASGLTDLRRSGRLSVVVVPERFENLTPSPCGYIRLLQPLDHLAASGAIDLVLADPAEALRYRADAIVTQRYALPDTAAADALARHCRAQDARLIYDLDDDLLNIPRDHPEAAILRPRSKMVARMLGHADAVWVSTEALRQSLAGVGYQALVVPNGLDERLWADPPATPRIAGGAVRILYMGTTTHEADFAMIEPVLARLHAVFGARVRVDLIGVTGRGDLPAWISRIAPPPRAVASYPGFVDWMIGQGWDIGIAPLADTGFNRCKSAIKALDYAALGMAVLASDGPAYQGSPATLVANTEADWFAAVARMVRDPRLRLAQAKAAQASFLRDFTLAAQAKSRLAALKISPSRRARGPA